MLQFISKIKPKPYRIEDKILPNEYEVLENGDVVVIETFKKKFFLTAKEAKQALKAAEEKLKFYEYEVSDEYIDIINKDIAMLKEIKDSWKETIKKSEEKKNVE